MTEVVADNVQLLGRRDGDTAQGGYEQQGGYSAPQQGGYSAPGYQSQAYQPAPAQPSYQAPGGGYQKREAPQSVPAAPDYGSPAADDDLPF